MTFSNAPVDSTDDSNVETDARAVPQSSIQAADQSAPQTSMNFGLPRVLIPQCYLTKLSFGHRDRQRRQHAWRKKGPSVCNRDNLLAFGMIRLQLISHHEQQGAGLTADAVDMILRTCFEAYCIDSKESASHIETKLLSLSISVE